ncbi:MAG: SPFH domain-containing protein, partial [Deferribacteraceae bacterium]|nr:SPFH domain-containing protein [Deferribacteraceae bacterium]
MFGVKYAKFEPGSYVFKYKNGALAAEGDGLSFFYYAPSTSIVVVPMGSAEAPFIFSEISSDFQELTVQGQLTYRVIEPKKTSKMLNFAVSSRLRYISEDPQKLSERLTDLAQVAVKGEVKKLTLKQAIVTTDIIANAVFHALAANPMVEALGLEILSSSIAAVKPSPETSKALEAETREEILKQSDMAIFQRRNNAVEQERIIRESELSTEIAVEHKNREIEETRLQTRHLALKKELEMQEERLKFEITKEKKNSDLVDLKVRNEKVLADSKAYSIKAIMKIYQDMPVETLKV